MGMYIIATAGNGDTEQRVFSSPEGSVRVFDGSVFETIKITVDLKSYKDCQDLIYFLDVHKRCLGPVTKLDMANNSLDRQLRDINPTEDNSIFISKVFNMISAGYDKDKIVTELIKEAAGLFGKFKKLMSHWPIQYSKLPEDL